MSTDSCPSKPPKSASAWWMNEDQYDAQACPCDLSAGHKGLHRCTHAEWRDYGLDPPEPVIEVRQ